MFYDYLTFPIILELFLYITPSPITFLLGVFSRCNIKLEHTDCLNFEHNITGSIGHKSIYILFDKRSFSDFNNTRRVKYFHPLIIQYFFFFFTKFRATYIYLVYTYKSHSYISILREFILIISVRFIQGY